MSLIIQNHFILFHSNFPELGKCVKTAIKIREKNITTFSDEKVTKLLWITKLIRNKTFNFMFIWHNIVTNTLINIEQFQFESLIKNSYPLQYFIENLFVVTHVRRLYNRDINQSTTLVWWWKPIRWCENQSENLESINLSINIWKSR